MAEGGSNSSDKPIVHQTPASVAGTGYVELRKYDFDAVIEAKGYNVYVDKAIKCPCRRKVEGSSIPSCKNCGGLGWVYLNRYQTKMVLQAMNLDTKYKEWNEEKLGTVKITCRAETKLGYYDRITLIDAISLNQQVVYPFNVNEEQPHGEIKLIARSTFIIKQIDEVFYFSDLSSKLIRLVPGTDFIIEPDSDIITFDPRFNDINDFTVTIRYYHTPSFIAIDFPRDVMMTQRLNRENGEEEQVEMPVHVIGKRVQYIMDLQNSDNTLLLDNSYVEPCKTATYPSCLPATYSNSDQSYKKTILSGDEFVSEDINITLADGIQIFPSNKDVDLSNYSLSIPVTIHNSDNSFEQSANPGEDVSLQDIDIILADGTHTFPSNININLSSYSQIQVLPSGTYIPKNTVSGPFDLQWNTTAHGITSDGQVVRNNDTAAFLSCGNFFIPHNGDLELQFSIPNAVGQQEYAMAGLSYVVIEPISLTFEYYRTINFAFYRNEPYVNVIETSEARGGTFVGAQNVVKYSIKRVGMKIQYWIDSFMQREIDIQNNGPMSFDSSILFPGKIINNIQVIIP